MRLYQSGALLTGARNELIRRGGVLADGPRIVAAGPLDTLMAEPPVPAVLVDPGDVTLLPAGHIRISDHERARTYVRSVSATRWKR